MWSGDGAGGNRTPAGGGPDAAAEERLESYLDEVLLALRGHPRQARRLLSEVEGHLRESIEAGLAAGLDRTRATEDALRSFGPPSAAVRGLPAGPAYRILAGQVAEAALAVAGLVAIAAGAAAVPAAVLGLAGHLSLVTGDPPGQAVPPGRCEQLLHALAAPPVCRQALGAHHLGEVIRGHLASGWLAA